MPAAIPNKHAIQILIDAREHELIALFKRVFPQGNPELDFSQNLKYGDIQILVDGKLNLIIERKRADDFRSSVTGHDNEIPVEGAPVAQPTSAQQAYPKRNPGRFRHQRANLILQRQKHPGLVVMFLFEGSVTNLYYGPNAKIKAAELLSLQDDLVFKYGIPTKFVSSIGETVRCIGRMRDICAQYGSAEQCCAKVTEEGTATMGTKKNVTGVEGMQMSPTQFLGRALVTVHGMTAEKAHVLVEKYHTFPNLLLCYSRLKTEKQKKHMLADYKTHAEGKKFGPKLSERVYLSIFGPNVEGAQPAQPKATRYKLPPSRSLQTLASAAVSVQKTTRRKTILNDDDDPIADGD